MPSKTKSSKAAPKFVLDPAELASPRFTQLCSDVRRCWEHIGSDCEAASWEGGVPLDNETAVEACLDADRLLMYPGGPSGKASNDYVREVCALRGGYYALLEAVKSRVSLA